jgi:hypothetical protein
MNVSSGSRKLPIQVRTTGGFGIGNGPISDF